MLLGITGTDGSGKGTVVVYLVEKKGFTHYSARSLIIEEITRQGLPIDRNQMRLTANELRAAHGDEFVVRQAYEKAKAAHETDIVIESIRTIAEAQYLLAQGGVLLAVDANQETRYARVQNRRSESDKVTFDEFVAHEKLESNDPDPHGMQKGKVMEMAQYTVYNDAGIIELNQQIEKFLQQLPS